MMKTTAIVLAGGRGSRMNSDIPKQYLKIGDYTLLHYTLTAFEQSHVDDIVVVCGAGDEEYVKRNIVLPGEITKVSVIVSGGKERYNSVYNGLLACRGTDKVLVHDGARCLVSPWLIDKIIAKLNHVNAVIAAVPVKDTIKCVDASGRVTATPKRSELMAVQTPQGFKYDKLLAANEKMFELIAGGADEAELAITDDACIMERFSDEQVYVIAGSDSNIKVTTPEDLEFVRAKIAEKTK
ncbi:MAG: 2-C-methyl-D-erythritol 4-phosphate cytidylyltransferase [Lachnospiraceae bacterium]|nr:2-C-methyl-D-erythritol 4-phosphate cytidylyltransferase [Lachnospiraceae bacterium]